MASKVNKKPIGTWNPSGGFYKRMTDSTNCNEKKYWKLAIKILSKELGKDEEYVRPFLDGDIFGREFASQIISRVINREMNPSEAILHTIRTWGPDDCGKDVATMVDIEAEYEASRYGQYMKNSGDMDADLANAVYREYWNTWRQMYF